MSDRLKMEPCLADNVLLLHVTDIRQSAVLTVVTVVAEHEILIRPKLDLLGSYTRIIDRRNRRCLLIHRTVHIDCAVMDPYLIPRSSDHTAHIIVRLLVAIRQEYHNVPLLRARKTIYKAIHKNLLLIIERILHRRTDHARPHSKERHKRICDQHNDRTLDHPR